MRGVGLDIPGGGVLGFVGFVGIRAWHSGSGCTECVDVGGECKWSVVVGHIWTWNHGEYGCARRCVGV